MELIAGFALLFVGAHALVRGASRLAARLGISPLAIGLTVVAFGTSTPELAVSLQAALQGEGDLATANVVGSNIFNVLGILGLCALIAPLVVHVQVIRIEVPWMIFWSILIPVLAWDGSLGRLEGLLLLGILGANTAFTLWRSREESLEARADFEREFGPTRLASSRKWTSILLDLMAVGVGLAALSLGARWLVGAAVAIARAIGVDDVVIGLTIVAVGTSLPEIAASAVATWKGERDIAVGNVVGSNVFNLLGILGASAVAAKGGLPVPASFYQLEFPIMIGVAVACLPLMLDGGVSRWEGGFFGTLYLLYTVYLVLQATGNAFLEPFRAAILTFVFPLTAATLGILVVRSLRKPLHRLKE
jgi:cation:H+ antiporter